MVTGEFVGLLHDRFIVVVDKDLVAAHGTHVRVEFTRRQARARVILQHIRHWLQSADG